MEYHIRLVLPTDPNPLKNFSTLPTFRFYYLKDHMTDSEKKNKIFQEACYYNCGATYILHVHYNNGECVSSTPLIWQILCPKIMDIVRMNKIVMLKIKKLEYQRDKADRLIDRSFARDDLASMYSERENLLLAERMINETFYAVEPKGKGKGKTKREIIDVDDDDDDVITTTTTTTYKKLRLSFNNKVHDLNRDAPADAWWNMDFPAIAQDRVRGVEINFKPTDRTVVYIHYHLRQFKMTEPLSYQQLHIWINKANDIWTEDMDQGTCVFENGRIKFRADFTAHTLEPIRTNRMNNRTICDRIATRMLNIVVPNEPTTTETTSERPLSPTLRRVRFALHLREVVFIKDNTLAHDHIFDLSIANDDDYMRTIFNTTDTFKVYLHYFNDECYETHVLSFDAFCKFINAIRVRRQRVQQEMETQQAYDRDPARLLAHAIFYNDETNDDDMADLPQEHMETPSSLNIRLCLPPRVRTSDEEDEFNETFVCVLYAYATLPSFKTFDFNEGNNIKTVAEGFDSTKNYILHIHYDKLNAISSKVLTHANLLLAIRIALCLYNTDNDKFINATDKTAMTTTEHLKTLATSIIAKI